MSLEGKVAFVSGASRPHGIGRAIALTLARMGADVAVSGWGHFEGAEAVADEIKGMGRKSIAVKMDVSDYPEVQKGLARGQGGAGGGEYFGEQCCPDGPFRPDI